MKFLLAVTVVLDVPDQLAADDARHRLRALLEAEPVVVVASAPFPVRGRVDGEETGPKGEEASSPPLPGLAPGKMG